MSSRVKTSVAAMPRARRHADMPRCTRRANAMAHDSFSPLLFSLTPRPPPATFLPPNATSAACACYISRCCRQPIFEPVLEIKHYCYYQLVSAPADTFTSFQLMPLSE